MLKRINFLSSRAQRFTYKRGREYNNKENQRSKIIYLIDGKVNKIQELDRMVKFRTGGIQTDFPHLIKETALKNSRRVK